LVFFFFFQVWLQQESILFGLLKVSHARLELAASSMGVAACLFFQCIMAWRSLPWARGSGCQSFSSPLCFTSAKHVSSISARSLIHGAHAVCVYVPVTILDSPINFFFFNKMYLLCWRNSIFKIQVAIDI
jgi:hypothetical protein